MSTYIQHGNFEVQLQPDYKFSHNGYGLCTLTANFVVRSDQACASDLMFPRGSYLMPMPGELGKAVNRQTWTCVRADEVGRDGNIAIVTVTYAAVSKEMGGCTQTEASITSSVVSEPIETHPNFSQIQIERIGNGQPLGGIWDGNIPPDPDAANNPFRAMWNPIQGSQTGVVQYSFMGFLPTKSGSGKVNRKAGVRSWMRPSITMRLTGYTNDSLIAADAARYTWWVTKDGPGFLKIPEAYARLARDEIGFVNLDVSGVEAEKNWLIVSSNMEIYGGLYKCTADLLLSGPAGWDRDIYPFLYGNTAVTQ